MAKFKDESYLYFMRCQDQKVQIIGPQTVVNYVKSIPKLLVKDVCCKFQEHQVPSTCVWLIRYNDNKIFGASEPQKCLVLWLKICRSGKMNAVVGKYINILIYSYSNLKYEMLWKWWFLWSIWLQIVLQKLSPFFPELERQQYDLKNLQNWSTMCEHFTK